MKSFLVFIKGLLFSLFIVKILISYPNIAINKSKVESVESERIYKGDGKRFEILKRISIAIILLVIIFNYQLLTNGPGTGISLMDGIIKITEYKLIFIIIIKSKGAFIIYNLNNNNKNSDKGNKKEMLIILKTNLLGICFLIKSNDWILTILSWELFNKSLYLFVSLKSENEPGLAAALKYFLLSALSTTFLLLGVCILYYKTGSTNYEIIETCLNELKRYHTDPSIILALLLILTTLLFKLSAAPFYQWAPDLYDNLDTKYTMWMIIIPKLTVLAFLFLITDVYPQFLFLPSINLYLLITGSLSLIVGSFALNHQWFIKRFFAFSGISHVGFMLLSLYSLDSQSFLFYAFIYGITTLNIFTIFLLLSPFFGRELKTIKDLSGLFKLNSPLSILFALNLLSLAGVRQL